MVQHLDPSSQTAREPTVLLSIGIARLCLKSAIYRYRLRCSSLEKITPVAFGWRTALDRCR